jgi:hypothetical protein
VSEPVERRLPLPFAFDEAIGYWTGDPDLALLRDVLVEVARIPPDVLDAWLARGGALEWEGLSYTLDSDTLVMRGDGEAVERLGRQLEGRWLR